MSSLLNDLNPTARAALHGLVGVFFAALLVAGPAEARRIDSPSDLALSGALVQTFDSEANGRFTSRDFLIGGDGFTLTSTGPDHQVDNSFCDSFGTSGSCLDTFFGFDFDVVFTGDGVAAFGFDVAALDADWTIETYDQNDVLLSSYVLASQSPGLSGFDRQGYFGATEALPIQYFTVRGSSNDRALIDNFAFRPVPEPGGAVLAGLGLIGLSYAERRASRSRPRG